MVSNSPAPNIACPPVVLNNHHEGRKLRCCQEVHDWDEETLCQRSHLTGTMWSEEGHGNQMEPVDRGG